MKKTYEKPVLVKAGNLPQLTAAAENGSNVIIGISYDLVGTA